MSNLRKVSCQDAPRNQSCRRKKGTARCVLVNNFTDPQVSLLLPVLFLCAFFMLSVFFYVISVFLCYQCCFMFHRTLTKISRPGLIYYIIHLTVYSDLTPLSQFTSPDHHQSTIACAPRPNSQVIRAYTSTPHLEKWEREGGTAFIKKEIKLKAKVGLTLRGNVPADIFHNLLHIILSFEKC